MGGWAVGLLAVTGLTFYPSIRPSVHPSIRPSAQSFWRPEDRVLITDFSFVDAVAASPFTVFAATRRGLLLYDRRARRWRLPVTSLEGYPVSRVRVALAEVGDDAVWLGLADGYARYDAGMRRWDRAFLASGVTDFVIDTDDPVQGVWARAGGGGWIQISRFGPAPPGGTPPPPGRQIRPMDVEGALRLAPLADALRAMVLMDARLRMHQFTSAARSNDQPELFFGTSGMGLVRLDPTTGEWEPLAFGLPAPRAGAVAPVPGEGVWVAASGRAGEPSGITRIADDLSAVSAGDASARATVGIEFLEARDLVASGTALWLATDRGLYRVDARSLRGQRVDLTDDVWSLVPAPDGVWAGTPHGVVRVTGDGTALLATPPVLSLARMRDSVWVGTAAGLLVIGPGEEGESPAPERAPDTPTVPGALRGPIIALAQAADTLVAATPDQLAWRRPRTGEWTVLRPAADLGRIAVLAPDPDGVWVGGSTGLAHWTVGAARFVTLRVPGDVPAAVRDVAVNGRYVWVATDEGVVRFDRSAALRGGR